MDKKILVDRDIEEGKRVVKKLDESNFQLSSALWFYLTEFERWRLFLASPLADTKGLQYCYSVIQQIISEMPKDFGISLENISILSPKDQLIQLLRIAIHTGGGISNIRFTGNSINGILIEDALIYRLT
jgi:hypothetical protein